MVAFELYPWHSPRFTGRLDIEDAQDFVEEYVWKPVKELGAPVFAFGEPWFRFLKNRVLDLREVERLGRDGKPYGSRVPSRSAVVLQGRNGLTVIVEKHSGSAGPPSHEETILLREAFIRFCL